MISEMLIWLGLKDRDYKTYEEYREKAEMKAMIEKLNDIRMRGIDV